MCSKATFSLVIFYLNDIPVDVSGVLKSPAITVLLSTSPFTSVNIHFMYLGIPVLG